MPPGSCRRLRRWHACICAVAERLGGGTELGGVIDVLILNARHRWVPLHLAAAYGKSGKGNPATLAARLVAQWKPRTRDACAGGGGAKKRKNEDDHAGEEAAAEARGGGEGCVAKKVDVEEGREKTKVGKRDDDDDEREKTRAPPPLSSPPPPKKRFHHDRA